MKLIYDAPAHHVLVEDGQRVPGGGEFTATEDRAAYLRDHGIPVREAKAVERELHELSRAELDARAAQAGIPDPENLPNKAAVIAALTPEPEAASGEGRTDTDNDSGEE